MRSKLLRYFSISSALALAVAIAALVVLYRRFAEGGIVQLAERQNVLLAHSVSKAIWPRFGRYLASAGETDAGTLRARPEAAEINESLRRLARELPIIKLKVYSLGGRTVFSTDAREVGERMGSHVRDYLASRAGEPLTFLGRKEKFNSISGTVFRRVIAESYIPVQGEGGAAEAVFEMYADVTGLMDEVNANATYFFAGLFGSFGLLYAGLFLIVRRADTTIQSQYDELAQERSRLQASLDQLRRAQRMVVRAEKLSSLGTLAAGAAHEILNPANIIGLHGQRMQWENAEGSPARQTADVIVRNVERIARICDNLRRFSRDDSARVAPVGLDGVVRDALEPFVPELRLRGTELAVEADGEGHFVKGDRSQLQQVLVNLVKNAMDAMPAGGTLSVGLREVSEEGTRWREIRVADTGHGIAPDILPRIFDPFFTTKPEDKGAGLGLSVSHGIIESHGGRIWAESGPGKGTVFFIRLPALDEERPRGG